jgi:Helix-turn-helix domain
MKVVIGYRAELDLNNEQITLARKHCGAARWAYNSLRHEVACAAVEAG